MLNMKKSQLVDDTAKILGHRWSSGGFWAPETTKLEALDGKTDEQLAAMNRASLYGLLNFYREYVPNFATLTEPLRALLGQDARPWTPTASAAVRETVRLVTGGPRWLNADLRHELRMMTRVTAREMAVVLL